MVFIIKDDTNIFKFAMFAHGFLALMYYFNNNKLIKYSKHKIINNLVILSFIYVVAHSIISSAKAAVEGLTVALAAEFAPHVRVNCIAPSLSKSKMAAPMLKNEKMADSIAKMHALKRIGEGNDFSSMVSFLLSKDSSWMTGQVIGVDGGRSSVA